MKSPQSQALTVASYLALGVALAPWVGAFARPIQAILGKVSSDFTLSGVAVLALVVSAAAALGTHEVIAAHPKARRGELSHTAHFWPTPAVLAAAAVVHAARLRSGTSVASLAVAGSALMVGILHLEWATVDAADDSYPRARWLLTVADYAVALAAFMAVLTGDSAPTQTGALCGFATALITVDLLRQPERTPDSVAFHALLIGAVVGGAADRLAWRGITPAGTALILLLTTYALTGVLQHHLRGRLTRWVRLEYLALWGLGTLALLRWVA